MQAIHSSDAPEAIGPYSQAIKQGDFVFLSGQIALDPTSGELVGSDAAAQARQVLANLSAVADAAGGALSAVVKTTIYLTNIDDFAEVNKVYAEAFGNHKPARATVGVSQLPKGALVEIDAIMAL